MNSILLKLKKKKKKLLFQHRDFLPDEETECNTLESIGMLCSIYNTSLMEINPIRIFELSFPQPKKK